MSRPKSDYADDLIEELQRPGWHVWSMAPVEADRIVRKLRREGYVAKTFRLDTTNQLIAGRNPQCDSSSSQTPSSGLSD